MSRILLSLLLTLCTSPLLLHAHIDGAGACFDNPSDMIDFLSNHQQPICHPEASQFGIYTTPMSVSNTMIAGCKYTISLCGPKPFEGFLLYAQSPAFTPSRIGSWSSPLSTPSQHMTCSGSQTSTITHINASPKMRADFSFIAPSWKNGTTRDTNITINARIVVQLTEWYTTSLPLSYVNIDNQNGALCPDPASLMLTACPAQGIVDTSGCPAKGTTVDPMAGMDMGDGGGSMNAGTGSSSNSMSSMNMGNMNMNMNGGMSMSTVFSNNWSGISLVFPGFTLNNTGAYIGALLVSFCIAVMIEFLTWCSYRYDRYIIKLQTKQENGSNSNLQLQWEEEFRTTNMFTPSQQFIRSTLHTLRVFFSIFLMIIWMTLNIGLVLMALCGSFVGFYWFTQRPVENKSIVGCH